MAENKAKASEKAEKQQEKGERSYLAVIIVVILVVAALVGYITSVYLNNGGGGGATYQQFITNFYSAPRVAVYETNYALTSNTNTGSAAFGCGANIELKLISSKQYHRNASTMDIYILDYTGNSICTKIVGLGERNSTIMNTTIANCTSQIGKEPTIFINYSSTNTTTIKSNYLYYAGDLNFLSRCALASEIG